MKLATGLVVLSLLLSAVPASATDLCFEDSENGIFVFKKIKLPKNPFDAAPVAGTRGGQIGVSGTVFRSEAGFLGFFLTVADCFVSMTLEDSLEGAGVNNCASGDSISLWTPLDCSEIF